MDKKNNAIIATNKLSGLDLNIIITKLKKITDHKIPIFHNELMKVEDIVAKLKRKSQSPPIDPYDTYARPVSKPISISKIKALAKYIGTKHELALDLWKEDMMEAKLLAILIENPKRVDEEQMDEWVYQINSREVCDLACTTIFDKTDIYPKKIAEWVKSDQEFVRRAAFVLIATTASRKNDSDSIYLNYLTIVEKYSTDERHFVKKAISWALKQIGKRSPVLHSPALKLAEKLANSENETARWVGLDALRELEFEK